MGRTNDIKKIFDFVESVYNPGKFLILPKHEDFHLYSSRGSYHIICARLMNLSYAQYLRYCRDQVGAEIIGKNEKYPIALFQKNVASKALVDLLNTRANEVLGLR